MGDVVVLGVSRRQPTALVAAMAQAQWRGQPLRIVHAAGVPVDEVTGPIAVRLRAAGAGVLDAARRLVEQAPAAPSVEYVLSDRAPVATLMGEAAAASLLVVGADDVSWFERLIGGEVAVWLAQHSPCPVLVVPENARAPRPSHEVVVAVEPGPGSRDAVAAAFEQAALRHARLHLLHSVAPGLSPADADRERDVVDRLVEQAASAHPTVRVVVNVVAGEAHEVLLRAAEHAGLLVIGRPGPSGSDDSLTRRTAAVVLRRARCPVLVAAGRAPA